MLCPNGHGPMLRGLRLWICEQCEARLSLGAKKVADAPPPLAGLDLQRLPYPVALTARRLQQALDAPDVLRPLFRLKDCFEANIKFVGAVLLDEFRRTPAATTERKDELFKRLVHPTLGVWVNQVVGNLSHWLLESDAPANVIAGWFVQHGKGKKLPETRLQQRCRSFVEYRNDALGHGAERPDWRYRQDLADWLPLLDELLTRLASLADWRLCLVVDLDRAQVWMGPQPAAATEPGCFRREQIGHFVLRGPEVCDLYPFLCYLPDPQQEQRLHFYDSVYRYQPSRKEADVLEYDHGCRHPRTEPIAGLEEAFTAELLASAFKWHRGRMAVIEGRVASFGELLEKHAAIVGRRFAIERVQRFLAEHDRGLLVIEGEPGKGKTALLAHLIEEVFGQHVPRPVHFFYRRTAGITDPDVCVRSLYHALLQAHDITEAEESKRQDSSELTYHKLIDLLNRQIAPRLAPGRPQLLFLDALDEAERDAFGRIPEDLPAGVYVIASTRPVTARTTLARRAHLHWFDLDDPDLRALNRADGFEYVQRELAGSDLPPAALDEIARLGDGNFLVLTLLCRHIRNQALPAEQVANFLQRLATDGGEDRLGFLYAEFWERLTVRCSPAELNLLCDVAGVLVSAHAPLTAEVVCGVLGLRAGEWDFALRRLAEYLTAREDEEEGVRETFYRIYHESFADFLRAKVAVDRARLGNLLADYGLRWQELPEGYGRTYALRFGPRHLLEADRAYEAAALLEDIFFLEAKTGAGLVFDLAGDFTGVAEALPEGPERRRLELLEEALRRDIHFIHRHHQDYPQGLFQSLWNHAWWYDCPQAAQHYEEQRAPGQEAGLGLHQLLECWRAEKERTPGLVWLRSLRPPPVHVGTGLKCVLQGHSAVVNCVAYSPDNRRLASGSDDLTVRVWDAASGAELLCLRVPKAQVVSLAFAPDGRRLAGGSINGIVRVWDVATGAEVLCLQGHEGELYSEVRSVAFSLDGTRLASASDDKTVWVWDAASGTVLLRLLGHEDKVTSVAFTQDGTRLASGSSDKTARVWDAATGAELLRLPGHEASVLGVGFSADGRYLASGSPSGVVRLWDVVSGAELLRHPGHEAGAWCVAFSPNGQRVASGSYNRTVRVWDVASGAELLCLRGHGSLVTSVVLSPDGTRLASASYDQTVRVWEAVGSRLLHLSGHEDAVGDVAFSPDGARLASGSADHTVRVWDAASGAELLRLRGHEDSVTSVAFAPDGTRIASGSSQTVRVWDAANGSELLCLRGHMERVFHVAFSPDGARLASGSADRTVRLWDVASGAELLCLQGHERGVRTLAFAPDGTRIASGSSQTVRVWDAVAGTQLLCLQGHEGGLFNEVWNVTFSHDGTRLAGWSDLTVRVWDAASGKCLKVIRRQPYVRCAPLVPGDNPLRAFARHQQTAVAQASRDKPIAWLPVALYLGLAIHPSRPFVAGSCDNHVYLLALEGAPAD